MSLIDETLLPPCTMKRVICHWSEGHYAANSTDLEHYHILIQGDGSVIGGDHSISDNVSTADDNYAAHTRGCNTGSIGVALCAMVGCKEQPFQAGGEPVKKSQWDTMVQVVAELCKFYQIPVTPTTVLGHGEVQKNLGIQQLGKWDPMVWPWDPSVPHTDVGQALRTQVSGALANL
jgi:N-acetyl-anhydromuramyl-L-alanine amidase AmpD